MLISIDVFGGGAGGAADPPSIFYFIHWGKKECVIRVKEKSFIAFIALVWQAQQPKPFLARVCGIPVSQHSGGRLAMTLVATINVIIFSFFSFLFFLLRRLLFS